MAASEIMILLLIVGAVAVSQAFPFKPVKWGLMVLIGVIWISTTLRRPAIGLALLAFVTPAIDVLPINMFGVRGLNAETLVVLAALLIWVRANRLHGSDRFGTGLGRILLLYAVVIAVATVNTTATFNEPYFDIFSAAKNHLSYMIFLPVAFHVARTRREQGVLIGAASLALLLNALQAIDHSWLAFFAGTLERHRAMAILAIQPNTFGAALAMYLPVLVLLAANKVANRLTQLWFVIVAAAAGFALLLTLSRGAWVGAAAGLAAVAVLGDRRLLVLLAIATVSYTVWVPEAAIERVEETLQVDEDDALADDQIAENSTQMRIEQYKSMPAMMAPRPIFGWGYKTFPRVFERYGTLQRSKGAHSSYAQLGVEAGLIGLLALGLVISATLWAGWRGFRLCPDPLHRWLAMGVIGGMLSMAISMASGARFEPQKIFVFFWLFAGIVQRETVLARARLGDRPVAGASP